ncbi:MAG TPA: hydrogenase iron-sulfur subunit [Desulfobulbus sp.]|nr:hydrogenase iron-sulfur subunit [Desulfobulbus sp.]
MPHQSTILAFCCTWCAYPAADLAGTARMDYPAELRIIRVMCSGMVHPDLVLTALEKGAAGVMVLGCRPGGCHYRDGNTITLARMEMVEELMEDFGFDRRRLFVGWCSAAEPDRFADMVRRMSARLERLQGAGEEN